MILMHNEYDFLKNNNLLKGHNEDFGYAIRMPAPGVLFPGTFGIFGTGLHIDMPDFLGAVIRMRSSSIKMGIMTDGTIDSGYQGEIKIKLYNHHNCTAFEWEMGQAIVQLVPIIRPEGFFQLLNSIVDKIEDGEYSIISSITPLFSIREVPLEAFPLTDRKHGGFGSTGKNGGTISTP